MDENKNQNQASSMTQVSSDGILVKDFDGRLKVLADGELKELDALLASSVAAAAVQPSEAHNVGMELAFPKFTDLAPTPHDSHFREPERVVKPNTKAELHFHPDDKDEVEQELKKINALFNVGPQKKYSVIKMAHKLSEKHDLALNEAEMKILTKTLLSYFQQTRNLVQTRVVFSAPRKDGGLGMNEGIADRVLSIIKHLKIKIEENDGVVVEEEVAESLAPAPTKVIPTISPPPSLRKSETPASDPRFDTAVPSVPAKPAPAISGMWPIAKKIEEQKINQPSLVPVAPKPALPPMVATVAPPSAPTTSVATSALSQQIDMATPVAPSIFRVTRPESASGPLSVIQDVKRGFLRESRGKLTGRLEELASMDLTTWRLLDEDPRIAAGKILGKIQNLEQESLTRRSQGIDAWRGNEVYRHYLTLGQASLEQKKDVSEVIKATEARGEKTLTLAEFEAISDLNRMLRF